MKFFCSFFLSSLLAFSAVAKLSSQIDCPQFKSGVGLPQIEMFSEQITGYTQSYMGTLPREAAIYGAESRTLIKGQFPYSTIGRMVTTTPEGCKRSACTATLISGCHILTARHCVIPEGVLTKKKIACAALKDGKHQFTLPNGDVAETVSGQYITGEHVREDEDFAVFKIDKSLGQTVGYMSVIKKSAAELEEKNVESIGYNADLHEGLKLTGDRTVKSFADFNSDLIRMQADLYWGASGGPIILQEKGAKFIVGINSRTLLATDGSQVYFDDKVANRSDMSKGVPTSRFYDRMVKFMRENPCEGQRPPARPRR